MSDGGSGRKCGTCTMCCKLLNVDSIQKLRGVWCTHCDVGAGCRIYESRPQECRDFRCAFLDDHSLPEHWKPEISKLVAFPKAEVIRIVVDPERPNAWKREPYYSDLKRLAAQEITKGTPVVITVGQRRFVVLPNRDVDLGTIGDDYAIQLRRRMTPSGIEYDAVALPPDDERVRRAEQAQGSASKNVRQS